MTDRPMRRAHPDGESYDNLEARAIKFLGRFSGLQMTVDTTLQMYLQNRLPALGPVLHKEFLARMGDEKRLTCLRAFLQEAGYTPDLPHLSLIYRRAKQTRDLIGHGMGLVGPVWNPQTKLRSVGIARPQGMKTNLIPDPLVPSTFDRLGNDCGWISAHVHRALFETRTVKFADLVGEPKDPPIPPLQSVDGEPLP